MSPFAKPVKQNSPLTVLIFGPTGSGKTQGALTLARGLVGEAGRIAVICTEPKGINWQIERHRFEMLTMERYNAKGQGGFRVEDLIDHIREASDAGYDAVVVDSLSSFWDGPGGLQDTKEQLDAQNRKGQFSNWRPITALCDRLNEALVYQCGMHVILTAFAREKFKEQRDPATGRDVIVNLGFLPRLRQHMFEHIDLVIELAENHDAWYWKNRIGAPVVNGPITEDLGRQLASFAGTPQAQSAKQDSLNCETMHVTIRSGKQDEKLMAWVGVGDGEVLVFPGEPAAPFDIPADIIVSARDLKRQATFGGKKLPMYEVSGWQYPEENNPYPDTDPQGEPAE
jgi:hypothetical protein